MTNFFSDLFSVSKTKMAHNKILDKILNVILWRKCDKTEN